MSSWQFKDQNSIFSNKDIKIVLALLLFVQEGLKKNSAEKWNISRSLITVVSWTIKEIHKIKTHSGSDKYFWFLWKD